MNMNRRSARARSLARGHMDGERTWAADYHARQRWMEKMCIRCK